MKFLEFGWKVFLSNFGLLSSPYKLNFAVTYKCNLKCKTCNIWKKKSRNELSLQEIEKFTRRNGFFSWVSLTGGEPFLRKDIVEIANAFNQNCDGLYLLNIPTNGSMPSTIVKRVEKMLQLNIPKIIITPSLDGPKKVHDMIRGEKGSWRKTTETFKRLKKLATKNNNLEILFALTLSPFNVGNFEETVSSVKGIIDDIGADDFHINIFHVSEHFYSNLGFPKKKYQTYTKGLLRELEKIEKFKGHDYLNPIKFIEHEYLKLAKNYVETNKTPLNCRAIDTSVFIDPSGNVYPCTIFCKKLGNVRNADYDLKKILDSAIAKGVKKEIDELKCPACWTPCEANQMIINNIFNFKVK